PDPEQKGPSVQRSCTASPAENLGKNEGRHDRCVRLDYKFQSIDTEFPPRDLLVGHRAGVRPEAGCGITDLAKITPLRHGFADHVLIQHRHNTNRKIACNAAANLEKPNGGIL